jgi:hypothetical protein
MNDDIKINAMKSAHPSATKHTRSSGESHVPVPLKLVEQETAEAYMDLLFSRRNHELPIHPEHSSQNRIMLSTSSMTSGVIPYRETGGILVNGVLQCVHVLLHNDEERYKKLSNLLENTSTIRYDPTRIERQY